MRQQFLVVTHKHGLTPFANRLRNEGHDVEIIVWKPRYAKAWDGRFKSLVRHEEGTPSAEALETVQAALDTGELVLLSDFPHPLPLTSPVQSFNMGTQEASEPLRLGAWISPEGTIEAPHLMIYDMGLWPGGLGLQKAAGATIVRLEAGAAEAARDLLSERDEDLCEGLVEFDLGADEDGDIKLGAHNEGWNWLQSHAFTADLVSLGQILQDGPVNWGEKFTTVVPVSVPPWPEYGRAAAEVPIGPLPPETRADVMWHDVALDLENKSLRTAGLDGLVGVAYGSGGSPALALQRALTVAAAIDVPEKQWRPDVGRQVQRVLDGFAVHFGLVL